MSQTAVNLMSDWVRVRQSNGSVRMPAIHIRARHPTIDTVLVHVGKCLRCRQPLSAGFSQCACGNPPLSARNALTVFLSQRHESTFRRYVRQWRADRWEIEDLKFGVRNPRGVRLFASLARCIKCGGKAFSAETLQCSCGESAQVGVLLPPGIRFMLQQLDTRYPFAAARNSEAIEPPTQTRRRQPTRERKRAPELRTMYELQNGKCYYCSKALGQFGSRGAFVRDHLQPHGWGDRDESDFEDFSNLALTCWSCNESKGMRSEGTFWNRLKRIHGEKWVLKRQAAMSAARMWRKRQPGSDRLPSVLIRPLSAR
jgi:hypothetical protein